MPPQVILAAIVLVPAAVLMLLRINAALVYLSLCLGSVLLQFVSPDARELISVFSAHSPHSAAPDNNTLNIILLLAPAVLTAISSPVHT